MKEFKQAEEIFIEWYNFCISNGVSPEEVVESVGDMKLVTNLDEEDYE